MKTKKIFYCLCLFLGLAIVNFGQGFTKTDRSNNLGFDPSGPLVQMGNTLYGETTFGGGNFISATNKGYGVIFSVQTDGSHYTVLHYFGQGGGAYPNAPLILSGTTLYGITGIGGYGGGTVFSVQTDGSAFTTLHNFKDEEGQCPTALILVGTKLYGMTDGGGAYKKGALFSVQTDGSAFTILHNFSEQFGCSPYGALAALGDKLYGEASLGGVFNQGVIFSIKTNGDGYTDLHDFSGTDDGARPVGQLLVVVRKRITRRVKQRGGDVIFVQTPDRSKDGKTHHVRNSADTTLYGITLRGGTSDSGVIFSFALKGSKYTVMHSFNGTQGGYPGNPLIYLDNKLYGTTANGGKYNHGLIYTVDSKSAAFTVLHDYDSDGGASSLTLADNLFYGVRSSGAAIGGNIFSMQTDGTGYTNLYTFTAPPRRIYHRHHPLPKGQVLRPSTVEGM